MLTKGSWMVVQNDDASDRFANLHLHISYVRSRAFIMWQSMCAWLEWCINAFRFCLKEIKAAYVLILVLANKLNDFIDRTSQEYYLLRCQIRMIFNVRWIRKRHPKFSEYFDFWILDRFSLKMLSRYYLELPSKNT